MKKVISVFVFFTIIFVAFIGLTRTSAARVTMQPDFTYQDKIDTGLMLRETKSGPEYVTQAEDIIKANAAEIDFSSSKKKFTSVSDENFTYYGGTKYFLGIELEFIEFHLRSVGPNVEVWVASDLSYGYSRTPDVVTQEQVDMLRDEFENNIYQTDTEFFGDEDFHDGSNSLLEQAGIVPQGYYSSPEGKKIILVENIKDDSYYSNTPFYTAGFYWGTIERYVDRNIVTLDSYAWFALMPNDNPAWQSYQYDVFGTLAHEFQHLLHADNDPYEETWINEGMSDFSQFLCGYGHNWGHVNYFLTHPENSLLLWGDYNGSEIIADYGQAYLLQLYLYDKYGPEFIRRLAVDDSQGIESVNKVLNEFNTGIDFNELFKRFSIAVAIDSDQPGDGIYEFDSIDLKVNYESAAIYEKEGIIPAWGGNYQYVGATEKIDTILFTGLDYLPMQWQEYQGMLWGNQGHGVDNFLIFSADLTNVDEATLEFDHYYEIEEQWDFGMVQVSTDGGNTWTSLANENTRTDFINWDEYPNIGNQLPGFTGYSNGIVHESFDLSAYTGTQVHIAFRYMTDGAYNDSGWLIDNISIPEINYYNDCSSTEGFVDLARLNQNKLDYSVAFINEKVLDNGSIVYNVVTVEQFNVDEYELQLRQLFKDGNNYMIVWYESENNDVSYVPFDYEVILK